jgi:hypothetical protein
MGKIYGSAKAVLVWLGKSSWHTKRGLEFMATLPDMPQERVVARDHLVITARTGGYSARDIPMYMWHLVYMFFERHWFSRTWVMQEAVLAHNISFWLGRHMISPKTIHNSLTWLLATLPVVMQHATRPGDKQKIQDIKALLDSNRVMLQAREAYSKGVMLSLEDMLILSRGRLVTDARDKVFGILSVATRASLRISSRPTTEPSEPQTPKELTADYSRSTVDVFTECARCLITGDTGLHLLSFVGRPLDDIQTPKRVATAWRVPNLPSWVPDLTLPIRPLPLWAVTSRDPLYATASSLKPHFEFADEGRELRLQANKWDTVAAVGEDSNLFNALARGHLRGDILNIVSDIGPTYAPTQEPTLTAFWRTLIANASSEGELPAPSTLAPLFIEWLVKMVDDAQSFSALSWPMRATMDKISQLPAPSHSRKANRTALHTAVNNFVNLFDSDTYPLVRAFGKVCVDFAARDARIKPFHDAFKANYLDRRLFVTRQGYLGIAPWTLREGDTVMIVPGSYVPFVFREWNEGGTWRLIGEAYVHGIMNGEAVKDEGILFETIHVV